MSGLGYSTPTAVTRRGLRGWAPRVLALWVGFGLCVVASAAWSQEAAYQGRLTDSSGTPLTGSVTLLELRIYNDLTAGASLYEEFHLDVPLSDEGVFSVPLGGGVPIFMTYDASLFPGTTPRYLEVRVNNELLSPRQQIGTVPTALVAEEWSGEAGLQSQVTDAQSTADANTAGVSSNATAISGFAVGPHTQDTNTQLSEFQVDTFVANNNFSTGAHTTDTNTQLNEAQVDGFVANNGFGLATDVSANTNGLSNQSSEISALQAQVTVFQTYLDSFCGDGVIEPGFETCDDGNTTDDGNGCTASCQANNVCGNGIIESAVETCDDGGTANGDGCSDSCSIQTRFEPCSDGLTVADNDTGLLWERKTYTGDVHDVGNLYSWSFTGTAADGTAYTVFLADLNTGPGFAGHTDWRLPFISELQSILVGPDVTKVAAADPADPASGTNPTGQATTCSVIPCIDPAFAAVAGPTPLRWPYWSASSDVNTCFFQPSVFVVSFHVTAIGSPGSSFICGRPLSFSAVRAVRAGSCTD